jgi:CRISPR-associated protein Cas1
VLRKEGERLVVARNKKVLFSKPIFKVKQVVIFGNSMITSQAIQTLMANNVDVVYLNSAGKFRGRLQPALSHHVALRRAQYEKAADAEFCLSFSRAIVGAKMANASTLIRKKGYYSRQVESSEWRSLKRYVQLLRSAKTLEVIRGVEGAASATYFSFLGRLLKHRMDFRRRIKRPPPDPINILLSLGYTVLFNQICCMTNLVGLDPYQGFFHRIKPGHASLVSDLMEEFRSPVIDRLVLRCVNLGIITKDDFSRGAAGLSLKKTGFKKYVESLNDRLQDVSGKFFKGKNQPFRKLFEDQSRQLAEVVLGKKDQYEPYVEDETCLQ